MIFFLHIPRAGGTSIRRAIESFYAEEFILRHDDSLDDGAGLFEKLDAMSPERRLEHKVLLAHLPALAEVVLYPLYGIDPTVRFTFLREPVSRVVSDYHWARNRPRHRFHELCATLSLADAIAEGSYSGLANQQTRLLASVAQDELVQASDVAFALDVLASFDFVGRADQLEAGAVALEALVPEWAGLAARMERVNQQSYPAPDAATLDAVRAANVHDIALWERWIRE